MKDNKIQRARLRYAVSGSGFAVAIRVLTGILQAPLMLTFWPLEVYGAWVVLNAAMAFVSLLDLGLQNVTSVNIAVRASRQSWDEVANVYSTAAFACSLLVLAGFIVGTLVLRSHTFDAWIDAPSNTRVLFLAYGCIGLLGAFGYSVLRGLQLYKHYVRYETVTQCCELIALGAALVLGGGLASAIGTLIIVRFIAVAATHWKAVSAISPYCSKRPQLDRSLISSWVRNGFPSAAITCAGLILLQGVTLVIGARLGAATSAIVTTHRMLSILPERFVGVFAAFLPVEAATSLSASGAQGALRIFQFGLEIVYVLYASCAVVYLLFGEQLFNVWTRGKISFDFSLIIILFVASFLRSIWYSTYAVLLGISKNGRLSAEVVITSIASFLLFSVLVGNVEISLALVSLAFSEFAICVSALRKAARAAAVDPRNLLMEVLFLGISRHLVYGVLSKNKLSVSIISMFARRKTRGEPK